jgi:hypothetical protein
MLPWEGVYLIPSDREARTAPGLYIVSQGTPQLFFRTFLATALSGDVLDWLVYKWTRAILKNDHGICIVFRSAHQMREEQRLHRDKRKTLYDDMKLCQ